MARKFLFVLLALTLLGAMFAPTMVHAQSQGCDNGIIVDQTGTLDIAKICTAMRPLALQGVKVGVFYSSQVTITDEEWFALIDEVQINNGLRYEQTVGNVDKVEIDPNGYFISIGRVNNDYSVVLDVGLELGGNTRIRSVDEQVKTLVLEGLQTRKSTDKIIEALNLALATGFPNAMPKEYISPTPRPTETPIPPAPPLDLTPVKGFFNFVGILVILAVIGAIFIKVVVPVISEVLYYRTLVDRTGEIARQANVLLSGDQAEDTLIFRRMTSNDLSAYPPIEKAVREAIRRTQRIIELSMSNRKMLLDNKEEGVRGLTYREQVRQWEQLYLKLIGTSKTILQLTNDEIGELLNPTGDFEVEQADADKDVRDLQAQARILHGSPLKVALRYTEPREVGDQVGILADISLLKRQLAELREAKEAGRKPANVFTRQ